MKEPGCQIDKLHLVANKIERRGGRLLFAVDTENMALMRTMCLYEVHHAIQSKIPIDVIFGSLRMFPTHKRGTMVQNSQAADESRTLILEEIRDSLGGFDTFNKTILDFFDVHAEAEFEAKLAPGNKPITKAA